MFGDFMGFSLFKGFSLILKDENWPLTGSSPPVRRTSKNNKEKCSLSCYSGAWNVWKYWFFWRTITLTNFSVFVLYWTRLLTSKRFQSLKNHPHINNLTLTFCSVRIQLVQTFVLYRLFKVTVSKTRITGHIDLSLSPASGEKCGLFPMFCRAPCCFTVSLLS